MNHFLHIAQLADSGATGSSSSSGDASASGFLQTPAGHVITAILAVIGLIVVLAVIMRVGKKVMGGQKGGILGDIIIGLAVGAICFEPSLIVTAIDAFTTVVSDIINSFGSTVNGANSSTTTSVAGAAFTHVTQSGIIG